jgi:lipocalin
MNSLKSHAPLAALFIALPIVAAATPATAADAETPLAPLAPLAPLCSDPTHLCPIDPANYVGDWYEIGRTAIIRDTFEANLDCVKASYALENPTTVQVTNTGFNSLTSQPASIVGSATIDNPSELTVTFGDNTLGGEIGAFFQGLAGPNYKILNVWTDAAGNYQRALVVDSILGIEFIWVLARTTTISDAEVNESLDYARNAGYFPYLAGWSLDRCTPAERGALPPSAQ